MGNVDLVVFKEILESVGVLDWLAETLEVSQDEAVEYARSNDLESLLDYFGEGKGGHRCE